MSDLFSGNPPSSSNGDKDDRPTSRTTPPARPAYEPAGAQTPPRAPLFPRREEPAGDARPAFGARPEAPKAPLFPKRDAPATPGAPRPPLFPARPATPAAGTGTIGSTGQTPAFGTRPQAPKPPLFPKRDAPATPGAPGTPAAPRPPLFPARPATPAAGAAGQSPVFGARPEAPKPPLFPRRDAAPAPGMTGAGSSLFSSRSAPAAAPSPFGAAPAASPFGAAGARRDAKVSDEEFVLLRDFLYQQSGIYIAENRKYLVENRLASRLRELGLRTFGEYYNYLRYDANRASEMNKLFESMTTNETSFFRNGPQLDVFRDKVLMPVLDELRAKGQKKLRIWSAGCSSGEEPYTLAIILYEVLKQDIANWDIKITANDLSLAMLAAARRGLYNDYAIRTTPADMLARYFTKEGDLYRLDPKLQKLVAFSQINLSDKFQLSKVERSHIVFCRNVIIYFDDEMKKSVINAFYDNLLPGGYLLIGHSESLHNISRAFKPEHHAGSIVYRKQS